MSRYFRTASICTLVAIFLAIAAVTLHKPLTVAHAQTTIATTQVGAFTGFGTCWAADCYVISTTAPYVDNGCNGTSTAQYATAPGAAGNTTIHATLLGAFLAQKKVALVVQGCVFGHPQIIGVGVQAP